MVYLLVLFQLVVFLLPLVHCRATVHLAQMTPKPHHIKHPAFSVVTMTPLLNRPYRSAPHRIVLRLPKAIHSFPLHQLHLALVAGLNTKFLLINRGYSPVWYLQQVFEWEGSIRVRRGLMNGIVEHPWMNWFGMFMSEMSFGSTFLSFAPEVNLRLSRSETVGFIERRFNIWLNGVAMKMNITCGSLRHSWLIVSRWISSWLPWSQVAMFKSQNYNFPELHWSSLFLI